MLLEKAIKILKQQGYRVVLNESTQGNQAINEKFDLFEEDVKDYFGSDKEKIIDVIFNKYFSKMWDYYKKNDVEGAVSFLKNFKTLSGTTMDEAINNPDEPASKKQLWALFCITKQDWRDKNLTKGEASELIQKYSGERHEKALATAKSKQSLESKIGDDIMNNLKPKLDAAMKKAFGIKSIVGDADLEGNLIPGGKRFKFFGSGCGFAWVKYDKRNKKLGEVLEKYVDVYRKGFFEKFAIEYIKKYKERELGAVLSQDIDIQCIIKQAALDFAESIGINTKGAYVDSRLD